MMVMMMMMMMMVMMMMMMVMMMMMMMVVVVVVVVVVMMMIIINHKGTRIVEEGEDNHGLQSKNLKNLSRTFEHAQTVKWPLSRRPNTLKHEDVQEKCHF